MNRWKKKANPGTPGKMPLKDGGDGGSGSLLDVVWCAVVNLELERRRVPNLSCSSSLQSVASTRGSSSRSLKPIPSWKVLRVLLSNGLFIAVSTCILLMFLGCIACMPFGT